MIPEWVYLFIGLHCRYTIPFTVRSHESKSIHRVSVTGEPDPLYGEGLYEMLRIQWNEAWYNDIQQLLTTHKRKQLIDR